MKEIQETIKQRIKENQTSFLSDLNRLIEIPSVKGAPSKGAPFGIENRRVLSAAAKLANEYGFDFTIVDDAVGYIQYGGDSDYIGIVGHLDVVEAGLDWDYPPFQLSQDKGRLFGRGVLDNKGPIFACLYGLKILKDLNIPLNKTVRIIFGTDEESGSADIPYYLKKEKPPVFGFTPDCKYPVVYGERGVLNVTITAPMTKEQSDIIKEIKGEQGRAFVPDKLTAVLKTGEFVSVKGERSPSNAPELGKNAITLLANELMTHHEMPEILKEYFNWLKESFYEKHFGEGINLQLSDDCSGKLMLTPYELKQGDTDIKLSLAIRYPVTVSEEMVLTRLKEALPKDYQINVTRSMPSVLFDKDNENVEKLSRVYEEITGLDGTPVTTTGATYARAMPNTVAFGPSFPGQKGIAHNKNEYMDLSDLMTNLEIYALAIYELAK